jgi:hypothetical protein
MPKAKKGRKGRRGADSDSDDGGGAGGAGSAGEGGEPLALSRKAARKAEKEKRAGDRKVSMERGGKNDGGASDKKKMRKKQELKVEAGLGPGVGGRKEKKQSSGAGKTVLELGRKSAKAELAEQRAIKRERWRQAALLVQRAQRMRACRRTYRRQRGAIVVVQSLVRTALAMMRVLAIYDELLGPEEWVTDDEGSEGEEEEEEEEAETAEERARREAAEASGRVGVAAAAAAAAAATAAAAAALAPTDLVRWAKKEQVRTADIHLESDAMREARQAHDRRLFAASLTDALRLWFRSAATEQVREERAQAALAAIRRRLGEAALLAAAEAREESALRSELQRSGKRSSALARFAGEAEERGRQGALMAKMAQFTQRAKGNSKAIASTYTYKADFADNKRMRSIVHHWGAGGGGSHYMMAGGKQFQKGNRVKGVVSRHSRQGAKLQANRAKATGRMRNQKSSQKKKGQQLM